MAVWAVSMAHPVCANLNERVLEAAKQRMLSFTGGTYVAIEGPQFSRKRSPILSFVGLRCDWNDQYARGETSKRSRDVLQLRRW